MKTTPIMTILLIITTLLAACRVPAAGGSVAATPTLDLNTQVQAAIAATATYQAAVDQAVQATIVALPPTPTPGPTVDYYTLTEEELAALIDEAVDEALAASQEASTATSQATSDGTVTGEETYATTTYVYDAEAAIYYAEELIAAYYDLYGDYASLAMDTLAAIEDDLSAIAASLDEMSAILEQGAEAASAAVAQLNAAVANLSTQAANVQANSQDWISQVQTSLQEREAQFFSMAPTEIASDRNGAILQLYTYLDTVKVAMGDNKISNGEMTQIAQLAANARASLQTQGGPGLQNVAASIDGMTRQLSRGEWPQARNGLGGFEASLPSRPRR